MPGKPLTDGDELVFRHVSPSFVRDGRPSSQAFSPTKKDDGQLSVNRSAITTAGEAFKLFAGTPPAGLGLSCFGTWALSVDECGAQQLPVLEDPLDEPIANPAHCVVDFGALGRKPSEKKGVKLCALAIARGKQYPPTDEPARADLDATG